MLNIKIPNKMTYYDVLLRNKPDMLKLIKDDIEHLTKKEMKGPFSSADDCSINFQNYAINTIELMRNDMINNIRNISNVSKEEAELQFEQFLSNGIYQQQIDTINYSIHLEYITMLNFIFFGKKMFFFENNLIEHLALTDINTKSEYINLPFESCLFIFNSPILLRAYYQISGKDYDLIDYKTPLNVFLTSLPAKEGIRTIIFSCHHVNENRNYFSLKRQLLIKENWSINEMIKTDWSDIYKNCEDEEKIENYVDEELFYNNGMLFFRTIINCLLYLSSNDPDIINVLATDPVINVKEYKNLGKKDITFINKHNSSKTVLDHSVVGKNVKNIIVVDKKYKNNHEKGDSKYSITKYLKFMVRGHWRNQAYGHNLSERKMIWIKPYMKGSDLGELIEKNYKVK